MEDKCPKCGFALGETLRMQLTSEIEKKYSEREEEKFETLNKQFQDKELEVLKLKQKVSETDEITEARIKQKLKEEKETWEKDYAEQLSKTEKDLSRVNTQKIYLENKIKDFDSEKKEAIEQAKAITLQEFKAKTNAETLLKLQEKENEILNLKNSIKELETKSSQGSQQAQGEVGEVLIEETLRRNFPLDKISEVKKGQNGEDVKLKVMKNREEAIGLISIESKYAKNFSAGWVSKLKQDMIASKADFGLIVTLDLPDNPSDYEGDALYICGFHEYELICKLLRNTLFDMHRLTGVQANKLDKANQVYDYVTSIEFAQKLRQLVDLIKDEREILSREKRFMEQSFAKREKLIAKKETALSVIGGDFSGLGDANDMIGIENINLLEDS